MTTRVVLLHATSVAIGPVHTAFGTEWPDAEFSDLLDSGLTTERARSRELTGALCERFVSLTHYARSTGPAGILATCSAFGPAIEQAVSTLDIPLVKPNEAMFRSALERGTEIGMLATFAPSVGSMEAEFEEIARSVRPDATLRTVVVPDAIDLLRAGDGVTHDRLVAERAPDLASCDAIVLAHFSTSRAAQQVRSTVGTPVYTAPESAVRALRAAVEG